MTSFVRTDVPLRHTDRLFIGGEWVHPSTDARIDVIDPATEELYYRVAEARDEDMSQAIAAARTAFDSGPWPRLTPVERADYLRAIAEALRRRSGDIAAIYPRQAGVLRSIAQASAAGAVGRFDFYADLATSYQFEEPARPTAGGEFALITRQPVGVVGAIIPWNAPLGLLTMKVAPALLAGCTVILKASPEAPGESYVMAEIAEEIGLPPGVLNVLTADRAVSERLVRDERVDKIAFTGSTAAGRRIASLCGDRIARCTLELGGKSAALVLDDADVASAGETLARAECLMNGQVCSSLTRIIVGRSRHDELVEALAATFATVRIGDPYDPDSQIGPLVANRQRERVEGYIAQGVQDGATVAAGGGRPKDLDRGWYVEPTVLGNVDNSARVAQEEIFGPVLCVIPADSEEHAIALANDSRYGLNASVFTRDVDHARAVARRLRTGTVGHNAFRSDLGLPFGGFKQSGIGREGGRDGLYAYLETQTVILDGVPSEYAPPAR